MIDPHGDPGPGPRGGARHHRPGEGALRQEDAAHHSRGGGHQTTKLGPAEQTGRWRRFDACMHACMHACMAAVMCPPQRMHACMHAERSCRLPRRGLLPTGAAHRRTGCRARAPTPAMGRSAAVAGMGAFNGTTLTSRQRTLRSSEYGCNLATRHTDACKPLEVHPRGCMPPTPHGQPACQAPNHVWFLCPDWLLHPHKLLANSTLRPAALTAATNTAPQSEVEAYQDEPGELMEPVAQHAQPATGRQGQVRAQRSQSASNSCNCCPECPAFSM